MARATWSKEELEDLWALPRDQFLRKWQRSVSSYDAKRWRELKDKRAPDGAQVPLRAQVLDALKDGPLTIEQLSETVDRSPRTVRDTLQELQAQGYEVSVPEANGSQAGAAQIDRQWRASGQTVDLTKYYGERLRIGIVSCTHFGNHYRQLGALTRFYEVCGRDGVVVVIHLGDLTDGVRMYKGQEFDLYAQGADEQEAATVEEYPRGSIPTMVIAGNHDYSFQKASGLNVVRRICQARADLQYCGMLSATFTIGDRVKFLAMHSRGGVPYARSYRSQKTNEQLGRGEQVPDVFGIGGLHVTDYVPYLGVHTFIAGCFQGQTPYLKEKGLFPDIGGWIAEFNLDDAGRLNRCRLEWVAFEEERMGS